MPVRELSCTAIVFVGLLAAMFSCAPDSTAATGAQNLRPTSRSAYVARVVWPTNARAHANGSSPGVLRLGTHAPWAGGPVALLVLRSKHDENGHLWLQVVLPSRKHPRGWIRRDYVHLHTTTWRVRVSLRYHRLTVLHRGHRVWSSSVVTGKRTTPTPRGQFALYEIVRTLPGANVGPFALHLTASSRVLHSYDGGPGRVALHGRSGSLLADPLGTSASHGCVRMPNNRISWLAHRLSPGVPVTIS